MTRRAKALSVSLEGDALLGEAAAAVATMRRLVERSANRLASLETALGHVESRLGRREIYVAVAGVPGSGKRTFFDALIGDPRVGEARGRPALPTLLKNGATLQYRAKFGDGSVEDFARLVPDRSREHDERVTEAERAFDEAQRAHAELEASAKTAADAYARAKDELQRVARSAESASEGEQATLSHFASAQQAEQEARRVLDAAERAVPARLHVPVAKMGWGARLYRRGFVLFNKEEWRALELARAARVAARERSEAMRERAAEAAEDRQRTWEAMREPQAVADARFQESENARRDADRAQADLAHAKDVMVQRRVELSRYVADRLMRFFDGLRRLRDEGERGKPVAELLVEYPSEHIPEDVVLIDIPDYTSEPQRAQRNRAWSLLEDVADGCILIWDLESDVVAPSIELLRATNKALPRLILMVSKVAVIYQHAERAGHPEPWERVDEARRAATLQFAEVFGRDPASVLPVALDAKAAIDSPSSPLGSRFRLEAAKLFELLRQERAILLGARVETLLEACNQVGEQAVRRADAAYKTHLDELEEKRMPTPEAFHKRALREAEPIFEQAKEQALAAVSTRVRDAYAAQKASLGELAQADTASAAELEDRERALAERAEKIETKAHEALELALSMTLQALESKLFFELGKRYGLSGVKTLRTSPPTLPAREQGARPLSTPCVPRFVASLRRARMRRGLIGAVLGAAAGWLAAPLAAAVAHHALPRLVSVVVISALGALFALTKSWSGARGGAIAALESALVERESLTLADIESQGPELTGALRRTLDASVELVIVRHGRQMAEPTEARERALHAERANLGELQEISETLQRHAADLRAYGESAVELSSSICR